jgi:hypothetical protein
MLFARDFGHLKAPTVNGSTEQKKLYETLKSELREYGRYKQIL